MKINRMKPIERGRYTCFICGGEIEYEEEDNETSCDFCGRKYEIIDDNETPVVEIYACPGAKTCGITKCTHYKPHTHTTGCENGCFGNTGCVLQMSEPEEKVVKINESIEFYNISVICYSCNGGD
jgi:DNA-directed RNA polymerase subunit RPC12/RpoP